MPPVNATRQAIISRLGGPFDYAELSDDLRSIVAERELIER